MHFLTNFSINLDEVLYAAIPGDMLQLMLNLFHMMNIRGRELYIGDLIKHTFNIDLSLDTY